MSKPKPGFFVGGDAALRNNFNLVLCFFSCRILLTLESYRWSRGAGVCVHPLLPSPRFAFLFYIPTMRCFLIAVSKFPSILQQTYRNVLLRLYPWFYKQKNITQWGTVIIDSLFLLLYNELIFLVDNIGKWKMASLISQGFKIIIKGGYKPLAFC